MKKRAIKNFLLRLKLPFIIFLCIGIALNVLLIVWNYNRINQQLEIIEETQQYVSIYGSWEVQYGSEEEIINAVDRYYEAISKYLSLSIFITFSSIFILISGLLLLYIIFSFIREKKKDKI
jgi:hypothetical protein